jgi:WD40 repeat protein
VVRHRSGRGTGDRRRRRFGHFLDVNEVAFSPSGEYLATASWDRTAKIVDRSGRLVQELAQDVFNISDVAFSSDDRLVATAEVVTLGGESRVVIWDWHEGDHSRSTQVRLPRSSSIHRPEVALTGSGGLVRSGTETGEREPSG